MKRIGTACNEALSEAGEVRIRERTEGNAGRVRVEGEVRQLAIKSAIWLIASYWRKILSIDLPFASSSISLSRHLIFCVMGS